MNYKLLLASIIFVLVFQVGLLEAGEKERHSPKVILIISDRISLKDLQSGDLTNLKLLLDEGSMGLIAAASAGRKTPESVYATVGAGSSSRAPSSLNNVFSADEIVPEERVEAAEVYARRTGNRAAGGSVLLVSIGKIVRGNEDAGYRVKLGALSEVLNQEDYQTALFGNSDIGDYRRRLPVAVAMDSEGYVPIGDVSGRMLSPGLSPTGKVTDIKKMAYAVENALKDATVVVVDFGDTARVDISESSLSREAYEGYKRAALENLDSLVSEFLPLAREGRVRLILVGIVPPGGRDWFKPTPLVVYGKGVPKGLLSSATTRTSGLVTAIDIMPYILESVGVKPTADVVGKSIKVEQHVDPAAALDTLDGLISRNAKAQAPLLAPVAALGILGLTAGAALVAFGARPARSTLIAVRACLSFCLSVPLAALLFSRTTVSVGFYAAAVLGGAAALTIISFALAVMVARSRPGAYGNGALPVVMVAAMTAVVVLIDGLFSGQLARFSAIPSFGFRYYGVGNEYMALAIGSLSAAVIWVAQPSLSTVGRRVLFGIFVFAAIALGFPGFGTNVGGAATAVVTFGLLFLAFSRGQFRLRDVGLMLAAAVVVLIAFAALDLLAHGQSASHMGESLAATQRDGPGYLVTSAARKIGMNLRQLGTRQGKFALLGAMPLAVLWFMGIHPKLAERVKKGIAVSGAKLLAVVFGAGTAVICNDNGIIAGSLLLAPVVCALLLTLTEEVHAQDNGS